MSKINSTNALVLSLYNNLEYSTATTTSQGDEVLGPALIAKPDKGIVTSNWAYMHDASAMRSRVSER